MENGEQPEVKWWLIGLIERKVKNMATKGVITVIGRQKLCKSHAGDMILPAIKYMAWGDAGVDAEGQPILTTGNEIALYNELLRKEIESHSYVADGDTTCRYTATLEAGDLTGKEISEMGLFDEAGDLIAYRTFMRKGKDADIPQIYDMDEIF